MKEADINSSNFQCRVWGNTWESLIKNQEFPELDEYIVNWDKALISEVCKRVDFTTGKTLLECGCGNGIFGLEIANNFPHLKVTFSDISPKAIKYCQQLLRHCCKIRPMENFRQISPEYRLENMFELNYADNSFDYLINGGTIEHYDDNQCRQLILEMYRVLKPNGWMVIVVPNLRNFEIIIYKVKLFLKKMSKGKLFGNMFLFGASDEKNVTASRFKKLITSNIRQSTYFHRLPIAYPSWIERRDSRWFSASEKILVLLGFYWANIYLIKKDGT